MAAMAQAYPDGGDDFGQFMVVHRTGDAPKPRVLSYFAVAAGEYAFGVHNGDLDTCVRGLVERVFLHNTGEGWEPPFVPERRVFNRALLPFTRAYAQIARGLTVMTTDEFVASVDSRKRAVYERAARELALDGLLERDSRLNTFVKFEKLNFSKKEDPAPRVIQPRSPKYNICIGVYIKPLEGVLYRNIDKIFGDKTVLKGMNAAQQGDAIARKWSHYRDPVCLMWDVHRYDQHHHEHALAFEHHIYDMHFRSRELRRLLRKQIYQKGVAWCKDGKVKYRCRGRRASGDMNTGCGNCLVVCAMVYCCLHHLGLLPTTDRVSNNVRTTVVRDYSAFDNGDDGGLIMERRNYARVEAALIAFFRDLGFPLAVEPPAYKLEHIEFCQTRPVWDGARYVMCRDPTVCLSKDLCTTKPVHNKASWNLLRNSVAQCGLALAGNMPVFGAFYRFLARGAGTRIDRDTTMTGFKYLARGMNAHGPVHPMCRMSFAEAFGINVPHQLALEKFYDSNEPTYADPVTLSACPQRYQMGSAC